METKKVEVLRRCCAGRVFCHSALLSALRTSERVYAILLTNIILMSMEKIYGATAAQDGVVKVSNRSYILFFGYGEDGMGGYNYLHRFDHEPTEEELRAVIEAHVNEQTQERIVGGYKWDGKTVWLSGENQQNYTSAYLTGELPVKVRLYDGDDDTSATVLELRTAEEVSEFYHGMVQHVRQCVEEGWNVKDSVDYNLLIQIYE